MKGNGIHTALITAAMMLIGSAFGGAGAQESSAILADRDGIEPPDIGIAYDLPSAPFVIAAALPTWPELAALLADPDGMNAPDMGFAYDLPLEGELPVASSVDRYLARRLVFDPDGWEPPDIGVAFDIETPITFIAGR